MVGPTSSQAAFRGFPICLKNRLSSWLECSRKTRFRLLHELLAARLTDAPEADVGDIKAAFELTLGERDASGIDAARMVGDRSTITTGRSALELADWRARACPLERDPEQALSARMVVTLHAIETSCSPSCDPIVEWRRISC